MDWRGVSVGVLYGKHHKMARGAARDLLSDADTLRTVRAARVVLRQLGARFVDLGLGDDPRSTLALLVCQPPDVVLNVCDAPLGDSALEPALPAFLERLGIPYTGSPPAALALCRDKPAVKTCLRRAHVPTPAWVVVPPRRRPQGWSSLPAIVKPATEDASCGIDRRSVVASSAELRDRIAFVHRRYRQSALVERFVDGRELNISLVGGRNPKVLPLGEIDFSAMPPDRPAIVTFEAKWLTGQVEDRGTKPIPARPLPRETRTALRAHALAAWRLTGCRDYARVDVRLDSRGRPFVLEVNANPDLGPEAGLARAWSRAGGDWPGLLVHILSLARRRSPRRP
ncbi:MAG: D-alanine--D-alanine ligase [Deltaproteobacteria bacterium]|nr:D-alanine--D-alanine ligase [Deltaproteobacteria bacterium]